MIPLDQTLFGENGDCYRACIASILEIQIESVPHFAVLYPDTMHDESKAWLAERGISVISLQFNGLKAIRKTYFEFDGYCIFSGLGFRKDKKGRFLYHSVVGKMPGWGVELIHDPHPDRMFVKTRSKYWIELLVFPPVLEAPKPLFQALIET